MTCVPAVGTILVPARRYRLLANLGHCADMQEQFALAAKLFMEAKDHLPQDEDAHYLEAVAYLYLGDLAKSQQLATQLRSDFPNSAKAWSVFVDTSPDDQHPAALLSQIPQVLRDDASVQASLASKAARQDLLPEAETYLRQFLAKEPTSWRGKRLLAEVLLQQVLAGAPHRAGARALGGDAQRLTEAANLFSEILTQAGPAVLAAIEASVRLRRSLAYELLGKQEQAETDLQAAYAQAPQSPETRIHYAFYLISRGQNDRGLALLRELWRAGAKHSLRWLAGRNSLRAPCPRPG